jgi:hypothetical protein
LWRPSFVDHAVSASTPLGSTYLRGVAERVVA